MARTAPDNEAERILVEREGRFVGAAAALGSLAGVALLGIGRASQLIDVPYASVSLALAAAYPVAPAIGAAVGRRRARKRLESERARAAALESGAPDEKRARLTAVARAEEHERKSYVLETAMLMTFAPVALVVAAEGMLASSLDALGRALSAGFLYGWPLLVGLFGGTYLQTRRSLEGSRRGVAPPFPNPGFALAAASAATAVIGALVGLDVGKVMAATTFAFALASAVWIPVSWWTRRRLGRERKQLARVALPERLDDSQAARAILTSALEWPEGPSALRIDALKALALRLDREALIAQLDRLLGDRDAPLVRAVLRKCVEARHLPALDALLAVAAQASDAGTLALLPRLLQRHRDPRIEPALTALLAHPAPPVKTAAAESLGLVGSVGVVGLLRREAESTALAPVRSACAEAIARIHIRESGGPGALSLIEEADVGHLSRAGDEEGTLSFATPLDRGR